MSAEQEWGDYHRAMSSIAAEMIGAARYLADHPDYATDEVVAATFRRYAERMESVETPEQRRASVVGGRIGA